MQDVETDSYWSIITGDSLAGDLQGTRLEELPVGVKTQFGDWVDQYPGTLVLSVDNVEHDDHNPYDNYFKSGRGFRGTKAEDDRLPTKSSIYSFQLDGKAYAVPFEAYEGGAAFEVSGRRIFLFRPDDVEIFYSTVALQTHDTGFELREGGWVHTASGARFDPEAGSFVGGDGADIVWLDGFDTFWFNWSMIHPDTAILGATKP
jgi:hypothetical protein